MSTGFGNSTNKYLEGNIIILSSLIIDIMPKKSTYIPVNLMANEFGSGIAIEKIVIKDLHSAGMEDAKKPHRDDGHSFFLLEQGLVSLEIDFKQYQLLSPSIIYIHPSQVHRIIDFENVTVSSWSVTEEQLNPEYLKILENLMPAKPLPLTLDQLSFIMAAASLCTRYFKRRKDTFYQHLLKDSCNALIGLVVAQYWEQAKPTHTLSRLEMVTKDFKRLLETNYITCKRPAEYAQMLHLSEPYLNECVRKTSGYSISHHIQQRVILEAKRLLSHTEKSVKEVAACLGYDDYSYFSRLFTKITGMTALNFRSKNLG